MLSIVSMLSGLENVEFMDNTGAFIVDENQQESDLLKELMGSPIGNAEKARATRGIANKTKMKINCHHISMGTSHKRMKLLMALCPKLRETEYAKKANKVAKLLKEDKNTTKPLEEQKKDFFNAIHEMAKVAGHLPTLTLN